MAGKVESVPFGGKPNLGAFKAKMFNMFDEEQIRDYEELRTKGNNPASGIRIDNIKEYIKKTSTSEKEGNSTTSSTVEELYMFVQWWEKQVEPQRGVTNVELDQGIDQLRREGPARTGG